MTAGHFVEICQYDQTHAQCRCPGLREERRIMCTTPHDHYRPTEPYIGKHRHSDTGGDDAA